MFDIGASELLLIVIVAVVVIGPKDLPLAMRHAGRWIGQLRKVSSHFRAGIDAMVREAELEDMEKKWKAQNEKVMRDHPEQSLSEMGSLADTLPSPAGTCEETLPASAESAVVPKTLDSKPAGEADSEGKA